MKRLMICVVALFLAALPALADAAPADAAGKSLTVRTFQFKHKSPEEAAGVIKALRSADGSISITNNGLVVSDTPENLKKIAARLAEFDVAPQLLRFSIRLVSAARVAAGEARVTEEVKDIAPKLAMLRFNSLESVGVADVTGREGEPGLIEFDGYRAEFKFGEYDSASDSIQLGDFKLLRREGDQLSQLLKSTLNLKLGQTLILSATRQPNSSKALMIVLSARR